MPVLAGLGRFIKKALIAAKGDLIGGTADNAVGILSVGTNGHALVADSSETTGMKWASVAAVGQSKHATGTYAGDGVDESVRIINNAFDPDYIIVWGQADSSGKRRVTKNDQDGENAKASGGGYNTNLIIHLYADLVSANYRWLASGSGTSEYYQDLIGGGDPGLSEPNVLVENSSDMSIGTMGSLSAGEWDWGDNDSLGYSTIYVRLTDSTDPDSKATGFVQTRGITLGQQTDSNDNGVTYSYVMFG